MPIIGMHPNMVLILALLQDKTKQPASLKGIKTIYELLKQKYSISETHSFRYLDPPYRSCFLDILEVSSNFFISPSLPSSTTPPSIIGDTNDNNNVPGKKVGFVIQNTNDNLLSDCMNKFQECDIVVFSCNETSEKTKNAIVIDADDTNKLMETIKKELNKKTNK